MWAGSYVSIWWPPIDKVAYSEQHPQHWPTWAGQDLGYVDPATGAALPTWGQALDELDADPDARPFHVLRLGTQTNVKGLLGGTEDSDRAVRYLCKYLTKSVAETYTTNHDRLDPDDRQAVARAALYEAHIDALHHQVRVLPCSPTCANWLRYGIQPDQPGPGLHPGGCPAKAHDRDCLGGRRALVSRHWTGKTLTQHRADRAEVVRQVLAAAGIDPQDADRLAADVLHTDGLPRFVWADTEPDRRDYPAIIAATLRQVRPWARTVRPRQSRSCTRKIAARPSLWTVIQQSRGVREEMRFEPTKAEVWAVPTCDRLWNIADVSEFLGVPVQTIYQWRHRGNGPPCMRLGKHLRFDPASVRGWVATRAA